MANDAVGAGLAAGAAIIETRRPHDDLRFEELARAYNYQLTSDNKRVFARLIIKECQGRPSPVCVLDVGCGRGIGRRPEYQWAIRPHADELWGLDPDETRVPLEGLFDHHQHAMMETADLPTNYFDVSYSFMVMEHVADPQRFMQALLRSLKPGGVCLFVTPNKRHYFTRVASMLHALHLDEAVLGIIKRKTVEDYHYPLHYRFNKERRIDACARQLGFDRPEYAYIESRGPAGYLPGPLRMIYHLLSLKRKVIRQRRALVALVCRITKPVAES